MGKFDFRKKSDSRLSHVWNWLVDLGVSHVGEDKRHRVRRMNAIAMILVCVGLLHASVYLFLDLVPIAQALFFFGVAFGGIVVFNSMGWTIAARYYLPLLFTLAVATVMFLVGPLAGLTHLLIPGILSSFLAFDSSERKHLITSLIFSGAIGLFALIVGQVFAHDSYLVSPSVYPILRVVSWMITLALLILEVSLFYRMLEASHAEVEDSHETATAMLNSFEDSYFFLDLQNRIKFLNAGAIEGFRLFGVDTPIGRSIWDLYRQMNVDKRNEQVWNAIRNRESYHEEFHEEKIDRWVEVRVAPSANGTSLLYRDIDARYRRDAALRESEQLQRAILENADVGLCIIDPEGTYVRVNPAMCRLVGYTEEELVGKHFSITTLSDEASVDTEKLNSLISGESNSHSRPKKYVHKSGRIVFGHLHATAVRDDDDKLKFLIISVQDLTDVKAAEQRLLQAAKMSSLGEMAGSIAHEINNPMTIIALSAEQLEIAAMDDVIEHETVTKVSTRISETVNRITKIIRGLKAFSRNAELDPMSVASVTSIIEDSLELCREKFRNKGVDLRVGASPDVKLLCRPTELSQVFLNLLGNAFDAIEAFKGERWVSLAVEVQDDWVRIAVTDCGNGIPDTIAQRILEPFFTTKELGKGTGLGLSISKGIVETHGGRMYLDRANPNTSFVVELKLAPPNILTMPAAPH